jgi:ABC-2 type transport system permease protein
MRNSVLIPLQTVRFSAVNAWAELWVMYSPVTWATAWLSRVLMQVVFFALIGVLLDSPDAVRFLFIGNAMLFACVEPMISVASTTWERRQGTLPLLVAAPARLWPVFVGRSVQWVPTGIVTATVAMFALSPVFGVSWTPARAAAAFGAIVVVAVTTYCVAITFGALVLAAMDFRNVVLGIVTTIMMMICGVMVPVSFWPGWVQVMAQTLPLTHGLSAVRLLTDAPPGVPIAAEVAGHLALAVGAGAGWLLVAALVLERLAASGRRSGTIEFAD